jgi:hypothetical protein
MEREPEIDYRLMEVSRNNTTILQFFFESIYSLGNAGSKKSWVKVEKSVDFWIFI